MSGFDSNNQQERICTGNGSLEGDVANEVTDSRVEVKSLDVIESPARLVVQVPNGRDKIRFGAIGKEIDLA
jgi:hypothetical protein